MKPAYKLGLAAFAGVALGAMAVQALHAQAKPVAYAVAEVMVKNQDGYAKEFVPPAAKAIEDAGGKYLVRGGKTISFEGSPPWSRIVVLQFESMDKAQAWWNSSARKDAQAMGDKYATFRVYAVEGASP